MCDARVCVTTHAQPRHAPTHTHTPLSYLFLAGCCDRKTVMRGPLFNKSALYRAVCFAGTSFSLSWVWLTYMSLVWSDIYVTPSWVTYMSLFQKSQVNSDIYVTNLWRIQKTRQSFWWPRLQSSDIYVTHSSMTYMSVANDWHMCHSISPLFRDIYVTHWWVTYMSLKKTSDIYVTRLLSVVTKTTDASSGCVTN